MKPPDKGKAEGMAANFNSLLNLLRHNGETNIRAALYDNAINLERVLNYQGICQVPQDRKPSFEKDEDGTVASF